MQWANTQGRSIRLVEGDITKVPVDAIANAANASLAGGGGVDGAIHRAGGASIMRELDAIRAKSGGCPTGSAVATGAGNLPARWVLHAVFPSRRGLLPSIRMLIDFIAEGCAAQHVGDDAREPD